MEEYLTALEQAFIAYRQDIESCQKKSRPTDGLLGFGHSLKDDACHERFDERIAQTVSDLCKADPAPETAEQAVALLIARSDSASWPLAAQWMLRAIERHSLPLIPFLAPAAAARLQKDYAARYRPWDRLPAQKEVQKALRDAC